MKTDFGGKFQFLPVKELHIEDEYQRGPNRVLSKRIADDFDPPSFGVLLVSKRNGSRFVIDGQRRALAAGYAGKKLVPCMVWDNLPLKGEAKSYRRINFVRQKPNSVNEWESGLVEEDPTYVDGQRILAQYGYKVTHIKPYEGSAHLHIRCAGIVKDLYEKDILGDVLHFLTACWPKSMFVCKAQVINAAGKFLRILRGMGDVDNPVKMMKRFRALSGGIVEDRARGFYQSNICRSMVAAYLMVFVTVYNKGRRSGKIEVTI